MCSLSVDCPAIHEQMYACQIVRKISMFSLNFEYFGMKFEWFWHNSEITLEMAWRWSESKKIRSTGSACDRNTAYHLILFINISKDHFVWSKYLSVLVVFSIYQNNGLYANDGSKHAVLAASWSWIRTHSCARLSPYLCLAQCATVFRSSKNNNNKKKRQSVC